MTRNNSILLVTLSLLAVVLMAIKMLQMQHQADRMGPPKERNAIVLYAVLPHPYFDGVHRGGDALAKDEGTEVRFVVGQESSQGNVNTNIDSMFALGHTAFAIYPVDPAGSKGLFARLHKAGCLVVAYGAQPEAGSDCPFAVATDTKAAATTAAQTLVDLLGRKGKILNVLESMTDANTPIRNAAIQAVVAKYKDVEILQTVGDVTNEQAARTLIESAMVARGEEIDGIICTGYTTTVAAATLLTEHHGKPGAKRIRFVGLDTDDRVLEAVRNGSIDATVAQNPFGHGYISCALLDLMQKGWTPRAPYQFIDSGCVVVTRQNVDGFEAGIESLTRTIVADLKTRYLQAPVAR